MRPIKLTDEMKAVLIENAVKEIAAEVDKFDNTTTSTRFSFERELKKQCENKIQLIFEPYTYLKMQALVKEFSTEIGWYGLIKKLDEKHYYIYDVKVPKHKVSGARVIDNSPDNDFYEALGDSMNFLRFQAHSHVNMSTSPSPTDTSNQINTVRNMGGEGFYVFQIWNKTGDINTFVYDIDDNIVYDRNDVEIVIADDEMSLGEFVEETKKLISSITFEPPTGQYRQYDKPNAAGKWYEEKKERSDFHWIDTESYPLE